jgi:hypothetical protein
MPTPDTEKPLTREAVPVELRYLFDAACRLRIESTKGAKEVLSGPSDRLNEVKALATACRQGRQAYTLDWLFDEFSLAATQEAWWLYGLELTWQLGGIPYRPEFPSEEAQCIYELTLQGSKRVAIGRAKAAERLGHVEGLSVHAREVLREALCDDDELVHVWSHYALAKSGEDAAFHIDQMWGIWERWSDDDKAWEIWTEAERALRQLGDLPSQQDISSG